MAYRRRQGITRASTFKEESTYRRASSFDADNNFYNNDGGRWDSSSPSLAAQAIRASALHCDSSHSSACGHSQSFKHARDSKDGPIYDYTSMKSTNDGSFWGVLARKAKSILEDDNMSGLASPTTTKPESVNSFKAYEVYQTPEISKKTENPTLQKGMDGFTTSLNQIGGTAGNAFEEGRTMVENKTSDLIQETRKLQIRRKGMNPEEQNQTSQEDMLKASRDVAMATAAKAKLLLRELKTVKADLAFAKERCSQLEEENKILREAREKGVFPADDDMIRLQLETLLAEKARLANENSVYARENRFLREIVEYHQLTMQDVVYLDDGIEEVTEAYPLPGISRPVSAPVSPPSPSSPRSSSEMPPSVTSAITEETLLDPVSRKEITEVAKIETAPPSSGIPVSTEEESTRS